MQKRKKKHDLLGNFFLYSGLFYLFIFVVYILWSLLFTQILFSYHPGPNTIRGARRLVRSHDEPRGEKGDKDGLKRHKPVSDSLRAALTAECQFSNL